MPDATRARTHVLTPVEQAEREAAVLYRGRLRRIRTFYTSMLALLWLVVAGLVGYLLLLGWSKTSIVMVTVMATASLAGRPITARIAKSGTPEDTA